MTTTASRFAVLKIDDDDDVKAMQRRAAQQNHRPGQAKALAAEKEKEQALAVKKAAKKQQQKHDKAEVLMRVLTSSVFHQFILEELLIQFWFQNQTKNFDA